MAAHAKKAGPNKRLKAGDNSLTAKEESALSNQMLENIRLHKLKDAAFKAKQKQNWEKNVVSIAKELGMLQGDIMAFFEDHSIETGKDEDSVEKAARKRARRLNTYQRLYAATHDGSQLDWVELQKKDEEAIRAAEAEADEEIDGGGQSSEPDEE